MPRELKKRGRREEKKRKAEESVELLSESTKRQKTVSDTAEADHQVFEVRGDAGDDYVSFGDVSQAVPTQHDEFYGLLEEDEQTYYANVNSKLTANDFESGEELASFIEAVHRETHGKELKVASSQSCSRYLEKVILLSRPAQLKSLFKAFLENLTYLVQHRFGSHCTEALFLEAAKHVTVKKTREEDEDEVSMESLFLQAVDQLKSNIGFLVTDRFGTHCIRVLMLVLSGEPLDDESARVVASRKKEKVDMPDLVKVNIQEKRKVPQEFRKGLDDIIAAAVSGLDATYIRALATHPTGNPFLQLALKLELTNGGKNKDRTKQQLYQRLFPDEDLEADSDSGKFIQGLIYDPTGSHLVEVLIRHLPGKVFKRLYGNILGERMGNLARNDVASYIAIRVIERLGKDDLIDVQNQVLPEIPGLILRSRTGLIKTLFERLAIRQADSRPLTAAVRAAYGDDDLTILPKMLHFSTLTEQQVVTATKAANEDASAPSARADLHGSLLAQAMLNTPTACESIQASLLAQPAPALVFMAKSPIASRALQVALTSKESSSKFRKQFVPNFYGHLAEMAQDTAASHLVDTLWEATSDLHFMKERFARELADSEAVVRESLYGRNVWRNWSMDKYQRQPRDWQAIAKGHVQHSVSNGDNISKKSAIQLARERYAKSKNGSNIETVGRPSLLPANA